ncbi:hypothetical protein PPYR_11280 [Photinus pyralis]|uniref:Little elongation complex subunit 2 C-terminal domain-containing protein n=2 Tax=Photinus pyralis TaxID=7054 RepID=A0A5N4AAV6_PHOPY|nr:uncharacterized protein LOC116175777 isoform X1 [Photinus pyralis]KAB0794441.1 hypothetical protein PPYR_11280 [Photinus pyralis]
MIHDNDFLPWKELSCQNMVKEVSAQTDFIPTAHVPLSNVSSVPQRTSLINKVRESKKFFPGVLFYPRDIPTSLTALEHARCLNALKLYQSGVPLNTLNKAQQEDVEIYKTLQSKIQEEHAKFLDYVRKDWQNSEWRLEDIKIVFYNYAHSLWKLKLRKALTYSRFYKLHKDVRLVQDDADHLITKVVIEKNVLSFGAPTTFACPTLVSKCVLKITHLPTFEAKYTYNSKLPVSQDANVIGILKTHDVDVVISMSGIKRLMDDSDHNKVWSIPFVVKETNNGRTSKNVVYIDKPLPLQCPTKPDFVEQCHKRLLRTNFCVETAEVVNNLEEKIPNFYHSNMSPSDTKNVYGPCACNYSIWNIHRNSEGNVLLKTRTEEKNIKFLLRQKIDTYEHLPDGNKRPIILTPKLEYQIEHGASICTKHELVRQWADLFFRPFSQLYRVRIKADNSEVVHIEGVPMQKINMEAMQHYQYKPHERLGALFTIFSQLTTLEQGNYVLRHSGRTGAFGEILKETSELDGNVKLDLHKEYSAGNCSVKTARNRPWCPIDVNYVLHVHSVSKRMPGMFKYFQGRVTNLKKNKKQKKKEWKNRKQSPT